MSEPERLEQLALAILQLRQRGTPAAWVDLLDLARGALLQQQDSIETLRERVRRLERQLEEKPRT